MRRHISRFLIFIKKKSVIASLIIIVLVILYGITRGGSAATFQWVPATIGNVVEKVSVTGTVSPINKADLAFQKSGVISMIAVKVGDNVKKGDIIASLDNAADSAALESTQDQLADIERGLRPQEYALDQANVTSSLTTLTNAEKDAMNAIRDGYVKAQNAIVNYADDFFTNPQSPNPTISINTQSTTLTNSIDNERLLISTIFSQWKHDSDTATIDNAAGLISNAEGYLTTIKSFSSDLSVIVNGLSVGNSGMTQNMIDADISTMNSALSMLTTSITSISAADTELKDAQAGYTQAGNQFLVQAAGSSVEAIASQAAKVKQAQAILDDDNIISPIDGLITKADPNVGEFAAAGESGFAVQSAGVYKVEAYVPEADIAKIAVNDIASSTLDAYGSNIDFPAVVTAIDPAETVLEGVPTYKVTLQFITPDNRIRSGMTSNLEILTHEASNVLEIPYRAVAITSTSTTVRVAAANGTTYSSMPVTVGLKGSDGTIEITSGLKDGDHVVTYVKN